jgi:hypothetical protein
MVLRLFNLTVSTVEIKYRQMQLHTQDFSFAGGGGDPEEIYNLRFILKIML